jgi:uncharacterized protein YbcV (DUF1398 family)
MDARVKDVINECTRASDEQRITFPEVVMKLMDAGVERYHADLLRSQKTYYMPDGESEVVPNDPVEGVPAKDFSTTGVEAAVRAIQGGKIKYKEFCERIVCAECVGYFVTLAGRRAVYYGCTGDSHVEWFPPPK